MQHAGVDGNRYSRLCAKVTCVAQVKRGRKTVHEGKVASLRRVKDDVKEVAAGLECGVGVENYTGWKEGDTVELFEVKIKQQTLEEARLVAAPAAEPAVV